MKKIGVYPGSFDPFTNGHLNIIKQAVRVFDKVYVMLGENGEKMRKVDWEVEAELMRRVMLEEGLEERVGIEIYKGLTARFAEKKEATFIIRGIRNQTDYQYEETLAQINFEIAEIPTMYLRADDHQPFVSSSQVIELLSCGEDIRRFVPTAVAEYLEKEMERREI